jgi:hypothetical protein
VDLLNKDTIFEELIKHKEELKKFGVSKIGLLGSFVDINKLKKVI